MDENVNRKKTRNGLLESTRNIISNTGPLPTGKFNPIKPNDKNALVGIQKEKQTKE
jgi:hypothetical protein